MATAKKKNNSDLESQTGLVIQNITIRPVVRSSQDIEKWRNALVNAEAINATRVPLYDLYEDILLDGVLTSLIEKRILGVTKTKLMFLDKDGKEVEAVSDLLKSAQFRELRKEIMQAKFYGISVIELMNNPAFKIYSVNRKHINPHEGKILYEQYGNDGMLYRQPPFNKVVLEVGKSTDLGLILKAAPYVIYKRGGFGDWANFAEIFGMPFREARYDGFNNQVRLQLEDAMEKAGSAAYAILPKEAEIKFHQSNNTSGSGDLYNQLRKACNEELSILILGQTETTTSSSSSGYAQSQTHAETEDDINYNDKQDELSIFNELVKPILINLGYALNDGTFTHEVKDTMPVKDRVEIARNLSKDGLPIDDDYLYQLTGIPKPANYDQIKAERAAAAEQARQQKVNQPAAQEQQNNGNNKKKLTWVELYGNELNGFFQDGQP